MKQQHCWFACDGAGCDAESPAESTPKAARQRARSEGWRFQIVRGGQAGPQGEYHWCPEHSDEEERDAR